MHDPGRHLYLDRPSAGGGSWAGRASARCMHALWVYPPTVAKTIQVRDVPDDVHQRLTSVAAQERRSLSELVRAQLVEISRRPTMAEMLARFATRPVVDMPESSAEALAAERHEDHPG